MANANLTMGLKGADKTAAAFNSVKNRARATGAQIRAVMGRAIAAAGAYLSFRSIKGGIDELGSLSDMAMKAGTSVEFLTKASTAFQIAGLDVSAGNLARAMQMMQKNTGESGQEGFFKLVRSIQQLPDDAQRAQAMVCVFGRAGLELAPLVTNGADAIAKMQTLAGIMPGVSQAAATAGNAASNSLKILGTGIHNSMLKVVGRIIGMWGKDFPGGVRAGALNAANYFEWGLKRIYKRLTYWGIRIGLAWQAKMNWMFNGYTWKQAWEEYDQVLHLAVDPLNEELKRIDEAREDYVLKLKELNVNDLAGALGGNRGTSAGEAIGTAAAKAATRVTNQLMMGGSSAANRLAILGPEYQNEAKKQTDLLRKIAENTEKTAENTDETSEGYASTDLN